MILFYFELALFCENHDILNFVLYLSCHVITVFILAVGIGWWREFVLRNDFAFRESLSAAQDSLRARSLYLDSEVRRRSEDLVAKRDAVILILASIMETRDNETGNHVRRTQHYVHTLALALRHHPAFSAYLTDHQIDILFKSAPLHDIGKVGIPDRILLKPGPLDADEFEIMKTHTILGHNAIEDAQTHLGKKLDLLICVQEIALSHHEKWNGTGYPNRLKGTEIPISARLMSLADVYDALISRRFYKKSMQHEEAFACLIEGCGSHFDPAVVEAFISVSDQFQQIAQRFVD